MTISFCQRDTDTLNSDIAHIVVTIRDSNHNAMSSRYNGSHANNSAPENRSQIPRRHSVAIQDLLNPINSEGGRTCSHDNPTETENAISSSRRSSDDPGLRSNRPSPSSSPSPSPRPHANNRRFATKSRTSPERREFRPTYSEEEINFIWYHRIDLGYEWAEVQNAFGAQFPDRQKRDIGGIQCKYYRHLENYGVPQVRRRDRSASAPDLYGMRVLTGRWYPWMR